METTLTLLSKNMNQIPASQTMAITNLARELRAKGEDVIGMSTGEPDFDTVQSAVEGGIAAIRAGDTRYTAGDGTPALKDAIIYKFKRDNDLTYTRDQITVGTGGKQVIYNAMAASLDAGDEVIIPTPYWVSYPVMAAMCGGVPVYVPCRSENGFALDARDLEDAITAKTKWLFLNFPNNPSGGVMGRAELEAVAEVLRKHPQVYVMTDDMYEFLQFSEEPFVTLAQVAPDLFDRVLTVNGMSKGFAMTGWRIGFAGGPAELIKAMGKVQSQVTANPCSIAQAASVAALSADPDHAEAWCSEFMHRRDIVIEAMNAIDGISAQTPQGAFYAFPDVTGLYGRAAEDGTVISSAEDVATYWLKSAGVAVVPGDAFGQPGHVRISYSIATDQVKTAMQRIAAACAKLRVPEEV